ncbi:MAG: N-formylglutamate amidohydrolase [Maricaulis sp.]|nr:N-formylglutamate amidohydrolase [Maricaulis sp.]
MNAAAHNFGMIAEQTSSPVPLDSANSLSRDGVVSVTPPRQVRACPLIVASPHSGRFYAEDLLGRTVMPQPFLRRSEDAYVDYLIENAPDFGAYLIEAKFPRVFVDVNRGPWELDPRMFADRLPAFVDTASKRAAAGLGVVPRVGVDGVQLYRKRFRFSEVRDRITKYYMPYHAAMNGVIQSCREKYGTAIVLDMHSMPDKSAPEVDIVLGDRQGTSCDPGIVDQVEAIMTGLGFVTVRNTPYAGGHTTEHYGRPDLGVHVLQIEISRGLYLDEKRVVLTPRARALRQKIHQFINKFSNNAASF